MFRGAEPSEAQLHEAQASRPWIHAAFAATYVAAHALVKIHVPHSGINIVLYQQPFRSR